MVLIAHRGSSGTAPENTMAAFDRAIRNGADMIELDVRLSADEEVVVLHDRRVNRTTGSRGNIREMTVGTLKTLDAGSWFGPAFAGERIPLLREVLAFVPPRIGLNVEAKTDGDRKRNGVLARALALLLRPALGERQVLVSSFDRAFLSLFRRVAPQIPRGVLYVPVRDAGRSAAVLARGVAATAFVCSRTQLRARMVAQLHGAGAHCLVYGVNTPDHVHRCERFGVDGIITDLPGRFRNLLTSA